MIISKDNLDICLLTELNIHDDILKIFQFDREHKILTLQILKAPYFTEKYIIAFSTVLGFQMTACDYWGESPHILDIDYIRSQQQQLIPLLIRKGTNFSVIAANRICDFFEICVTFTSGDTLIVVCDKITISKNNVNNVNFK